MPPVFLSRISTHQRLLHVSRLAYTALKFGTGVGVGGGVNTGNAAKFPVTVAYSPHNQQNPLGWRGLRMYQ